MTRKVYRKVMSLLVGSSLFSVSLGMGGCYTGIITEVCNELGLCEDGQLNLDQLESEFGDGGSGDSGGFDPFEEEPFFDEDGLDDDSLYWELL